MTAAALRLLRAGTVAAAEEALLGVALRLLRAGAGAVDEEVLLEELLEEEETESAE